ncbi:SDR family oxidoreductase [Variovorax sp. EL159]|uniref:SDR family oxidoreductase n=1 Tax=Variovorax sp. EL159 TaxID=1566270 RepID=UPI000883214D|nr:SDR family oxidoreductase [Variovorax sp. EL159]SCX72595.1 3-oxoacyl-[acyl-carrier protein] reductase [Variovorax sp. EL159]
MTSANAALHRRVVITGAAGGLGRAMALGLLDAGYSVMLVDQDATRIGETLALADARRVGERAFRFDADLTATDASVSIMDAAQVLLGGIDILVNNAGLGPGLISKNYFSDPPAFDSLSDTLVRQFFEVNGIAPMLLAMHAARRMRLQRWGRIVNVTTSHDSMMRRGFAPYGGTKASLESHSAIMARDLEGSGITVNVLVPGGAADTAMIPQESGFERAQLIRPESMVAPLLWLLADVPDAPHERRVLAAGWTPEASTNGHPSVAPIGWPGTGSPAILPSNSH